MKKNLISPALIVLVFFQFFLFSCMNARKENLNEQNPEDLSRQLNETGQSSQQIPLSAKEFCSMKGPPDWLSFADENALIRFDTPETWYVSLSPDASLHPYAIDLQALEEVRIAGLEGNGALTLYPSMGLSLEEWLKENNVSWISEEQIDESKLYPDGEALIMQMVPGNPATLEIFYLYSLQGDYVLELNFWLAPREEAFPRFKRFAESLEIKTTEAYNFVLDEEALSKLEDTLKPNQISSPAVEAGRVDPQEWTTYAPEFANFWLDLPSNWEVNFQMNEESRADLKLIQEYFFQGDYSTINLNVWDYGQSDIEQALNNLYLLQAGKETIAQAEGKLNGQVFWWKLDLPIAKPGGFSIYVFHDDLLYEMIYWLVNPSPDIEITRQVMESFRFSERVMSDNELPDEVFDCISDKIYPLKP